MTESSHPALAIKGLEKFYGKSKKALDDVSFTVDEGDFFALLGPNGAGKTTLIGILTGLTHKTAGEVRILGHSIDQDFNTAKCLMGVMPQEFNFNVFETVLNIVVCQAGFYGIPYRKALKDAEPILTRLKLWDMKDQPARTLSGGMKRRLMIARALIHSPRILILDEPTAGVDVELRHSLWEFVQDINQKGTTIILTTHYLEEAEKLCRNLAIIHKGRVIEKGPTRELLLKNKADRLEELFLRLTENNS